MSANSDHGNMPVDPIVSNSIWTRRLIIALTIIAWIAIACFAIFLIWLVGESFILLLIGGLIGYIMYPFVQLFQRVMPRALAIVLVYLILLVALIVLLYLVGVSFIQQLTAFIIVVTQLFSPEGQLHIRPLLDVLQQLGISKEVFAGFGSVLVAQLRGLLSGALPFVGGVFTWIIFAITIATLSIYFILDGSRVVNWFRLKTPLKYRDAARFMLTTVDKAVGGYFRGLLLVAIVAGVGAGVILRFAGSPFFVLLGVLSFALFFIPMIGGFVSGLLCILITLPLGWQTALIVGICIVFLQVVILGSVLEPRIFHGTVGVHPIIIIFAIFAGIERFGIIGALLAVPVAGVIQQILIAYWKRYRADNPDQFPQEMMQAEQTELEPADLTKSISEN
ncbi:MAG TPA: AI-2E family transporter [Ktedonobacteraceae bacterium]|nr:AI-2E family transporter [Ktedonobacteraceae bacterium]